MSISAHLQAAAGWILDRGTEVAETVYAPAGDSWRPFCRVVAPEALQYPRVGMRWVTQVGEAAGRPWRPGQEPESSTIGKGYARQIAAGQFRRERRIGLDLVESSRNLAFDQVAAFIAEYSTDAANRRNRMFAAILQKGTLSAGDTAVFDQTFDEHEDANRGKIYDGKPLFAATGNAHPFKFYTATGDEGVNLITSLDLTTANLPTAFTQFSNTNARDETGQEIDLFPTYCIVGSGMVATATQVFQSERVAEGNNNAINPYRNRVEVVENRFIRDTASATAWWLAQGDRAFKAVDSGPVRVGQTIDERLGVLTVWCDDFFSIAAEDWRYVMACDKAAS